MKPGSAQHVVRVFVVQRFVCDAEKARNFDSDRVGKIENINSVIAFQQQLAASTRGACVTHWAHWRCGQLGCELVDQLHAADLSGISLNTEIAKH